MTFLRRCWQFLLLGFVPLAVGLERLMPENHTAIFATSANCWGRPSQRPLAISA
jgi:hypothetical protein